MDPIRISTSIACGTSSSTASARSIASAIVDAISVTTHGVAAALLDADGNLALPVLDYEHDGPEQLAADMMPRARPLPRPGRRGCRSGSTSARSCSGRRVYFPEFAGSRASLMYPQYWAYRLTGVLANEVTSLGCHTDLWNFRAGDFSTLVDKRGVARADGAAAPRRRPARA